MTTHTDIFERNVQEALSLLDTNTYWHIREAILRYKPPLGTGYMFSAHKPPEISQLEALLDHQGHSGASWACLLQRIRKDLIKTQMALPLSTEVWNDALDMLKQELIEEKKAPSSINKNSAPF